MADTPKRKGGLRLTPRERLQLFHAPHEFQPTRRQVLAGLLGTLAAGCGDGGGSGTQGTTTTGGTSSGTGATGGTPPGTGGASATGGTTTAGAGTGGTPATGGTTTGGAGTGGAPTTGGTTTGGAGTGGAPATGGTTTGGAGTGGAPTTGGTTTGGAGTGGTATVSQRSPYDLVEIGSTGIVTSRLAMGGGTTGYNGSSQQAQMGAAFTDLLVQGYERGIRFFETADAYGSHGRVRDAMQQVGRQNVTLLTKTLAETRAEAEADLARFMQELGTDYIDIVLLHIRTSARWTTEGEGAMAVLSEAKQRGQIRAHGVSCHSLEALRLAGQTDWVDVDLARINPFGLHMDADPATVIAELEAMKASGKGVLAMKILAQGDAVDRFDEAIEHVTRLSCIHGFTIGFTSLDQLDQVATKMQSVRI